MLKKGGRMYRKNNNDFDGFLVRGLQSIVNKEVAIFLTNGVKLDGILTFFVEGAYMVLKKNHQQQQIIWSSIATINGDILLEPITQEENLELNPMVDFLSLKISKHINIFLENGIKLSGNLIQFKPHDYLVISSQNNSQIILWHAISSIIEDINNNNISDINDNHVFLKSGIKLVGRIVDYKFNDYLIMEKNNIRQIVFFRFIATISKILS